MLKKAGLLVLLMVAQVVFLFAADRVFKQGVKDQVSLMRQALPAKGIPPNQVDALAGVVEDAGYDASGHILLVAMLLVMFNTAAVFTATAKRE